MKTEEEYKAEVLQLIRDLYPTLKGEERKRAEHLFPELIESEDEKIRKDIIVYLQYSMAFDKSFLDKRYNWSQKDCSKWIDWLEKQGEHANFRNKIQIGDQVTRNKDGMLVNLSQLKRVAKQDEPIWSEEDEKMYNNIISFVPQHLTAESYTACITWFESLKDRVQCKSNK